MLESSGKDYARTGESLEWPTVTFDASFKPFFAVVYREAPLKGLRTFPQRKKRRHKKEYMKRTANIVGEMNFNNEPTHTLMMDKDGLLHLD